MGWHMGSVSPDPLVSRLDMLSAELGNVKASLRCVAIIFRCGKKLLICFTPLDSKLDQLLELLRNPRDPKHAAGIHEACVAFHQQPRIAPRHPIQLSHRRRIQSPLPLPPPHYPHQRPIQLPHRHRIQSPLPLPPPRYPLLHPLQHPHSRRCPSQHPYPHHQHHPHPHPHSHPHQPPIQRPRPGRGNRTRTHYCGGARSICWYRCFRTGSTSRHNDHTRACTRRLEGW
ncbi:hypothetical protein DFH08DRAFT_986983 [Mycena albidolilacea]|uniref:Uncharacterized protein n=1 Tax=Mycena albidolilacea TaxID=1033008 RepID=A0AAD7A9M4_9AGAR|nr:hypothetical protein DFH08DRAFT_986983 [Mycena albidolilacea]